MVELTTVMLSVKIIYMIHIQMKVNHFKFWILSAIEWRINEMMVRNASNGGVGAKILAFHGLRTPLANRRER